MLLAKIKFSNKLLFRKALIHGVKVQLKGKPPNVDWLVKIIFVIKLSSRLPCNNYNAAQSSRHPLSVDVVFEEIPNPAPLQLTPYGTSG